LHDSERTTVSMFSAAVVAAPEPKLVEARLVRGLPVER
jgi:hypothetical protein